MRHVIVKIQKPLGVHPVSGLILVYDQTRAIHMFIDMDEYLLEAMGNRPKVYALASIDAAGKLEIKELIADQPW